VVIALVLLGKYLESRAKRQTSAAIRALEALRPDRAVRVVDGREEEVAIAVLRLNDLVLVKPGERFPVDGEVVEGESQADEALISGESLPVAKAPGDSITGGAINGEGRLLARPTALGGETVLARIDRTSTRLNSGLPSRSRIPSSAGSIKSTVSRSMMPT